MDRVDHGGFLEVSRGVFTGNDDRVDPRNYGCHGTRYNMVTILRRAGMRLLEGERGERESVRKKDKRNETQRQGEREGHI